MSVKKEASVKQRLMQSTKEMLMEFAREIELKGAYKMKKAELVEGIYAYFTCPEFLFYKMAVMSDSEIRFFMEICGKEWKVDPKKTKFEFLARLNVFDLICFDDDTYYVPEDIAESWNQIDHEKFYAYHKRAFWVWKCLYFAESFYGCFPTDRFLDVINTNKKMHMTKEELYDIYDFFPMDQLGVVREDDLFLAEEYAEDEDLLYELRCAQGDKDYYVPTTDEIEVFYKDDALIINREYQSFIKFLEREMGLSHKKAYDLAWELFFVSAFDEDNDFNETVQWLLDQLPIENEKTAQLVLNHYMATANNTRMLFNRGFTPNEMQRRMPMTKLPTIVAGSSHAAEMLTEAAPELQKMGFGLDLECNADTVPVRSLQNGIKNGTVIKEKKVYPNDPCPCGSGKKYKKCCGKK